MAMLAIILIFLRLEFLRYKMRFIVLLFFVITAHAQIRPADQQYIPQENLLLNPGLEQGRVNWTISGTATVSLEQTASAVLAGLSSLKIVASSQTFEVAQFTTKSASSLNGMQAMASVRVKTNQSGVQVCSIENSVHVKCVSVDSTNQAKEYIIPFVFNSTNNGIVIKGASGTGTTYIDDAYVGIMPANRMPEISQAQIAGEAYFAATTNCLWSRTNTALGAFGTDADCPAPTIIRQNIGSWQTTDADLPRFTVNNLPAGQYKAIMIASIQGDGTNNSEVAITDGITTCQSQASNRNSNNTPVVAECTFSYDSSGNRSFELHAASAGGAVTLDNRLVTSTKQQLKFILEYYPPKSKVYSGATIYPHAQIAGKSDFSSGGQVSTTSYATFTGTRSPQNIVQKIGQWASASITGYKQTVLNLPKGCYRHEWGVTIVGNTINGDNFLCAHENNNCDVNSESSSRTAASSGYPHFVSGFKCYDSDQSSVDFELKGKLSVGNFTVTNLGPSFKLTYYPPQDNPIIGTFEGIEKCEDDFECTNTFSAKVSSAGVVSGENLDWINGNAVVTSTSNYAITFNSGIFTTAPNCTTTIDTNAGNGAVAQTYLITSSGLSVVTVNVSDTLVAKPFTLKCQKTGSDFKAKTAKAATTNEMMYVPNVTRPKTCYYAFGGASATLSSPTVCSTGTCVEVYDSCSAGTPPSYISTGRYDNLTFANGTWKGSSFLNCTCSGFSATDGVYYDCRKIFRSSDQTWATTASGGAVLNVFSADAAGGLGNSYVYLECTADAP